MKPDGVFVAALLGAGTLGEMQYAFAAAEEERTGGVSPHASPAARLADCGQLLQKAGFQLITVDARQPRVPRGEGGPSRPPTSASARARASDAPARRRARTRGRT